MVTEALGELEREKNRKTPGSGDTLKTSPDCHFLSQRGLVIRITFGRDHILKHDCASLYWLKNVCLTM